MNIEFEKHIIELLKHNQCVILPGFGGFILKSIPSSIHKNTIFPPSKEIAFNQNLKQDDELLTGALMGSYSLEYANAKNKVASFSNQISYLLKKDQSYVLNQIGAFTVNGDNQISFKPFLSTFVDKNSFGLHNFHVRKIEKAIISQPTSKVRPTVETVSAVKKEERKTKARKKSKVPLFGIVFSLLCLAVIGGLIATDTHLGNQNIQQAGFVNMFFPNDTHVVSFDNGIATLSEELFPVSPKEGLKTGRVHVVTNPEISEGYYLVLGSYSSLNNAERMEAKLFDEGKDSYIVPSENGFYRVCVFADKKYSMAKQLLESAYYSKRDVWLINNLPS